jgi:GH24 family phage-related lysozyme (muramidase)
MNWYKNTHTEQQTIKTASIKSKLLALGLAVLIPYISILGLRAINDIVDRNPNNPEAIKSEVIREVQRSTSQPTADYVQPIDGSNAGYVEMDKPVTVGQPGDTTPPDDEFDLARFAKHIRKYEGFANRMYNDPRGNPTIGIGHLLKDDDRELFQKLFGNLVNFDSIMESQQALTDEQVYQLAKYDVDEHLKRAQKTFKDFDSYPYYLQEALLDSVYRGDTGPKTISLINNGNWAHVPAEYLNRYDYKNAKKLNVPGIIGRMNKNAAAFAKWAYEQGLMSKEAYLSWLTSLGFSFQQIVSR